jgi:hypothetical protein
VLWVCNTKCDGLRLEQYQPGDPDNNIAKKHVGFSVERASGEVSPGIQPWPGNVIEGAYSASSGRTTIRGM